MSPSASAAVTGSPTSAPASLFSGTLRVRAAPENVGALLAGGEGGVLVRAASEASDQSLGVSPLSARTRAWYSVLAVRPVMAVLVPVPSCVQSFHAPSSASRYCSS